MRNLGMMALALDAADDPNNQLRNYLGNATGAWLYTFDNLSRTDSKGGFLPEGFEYSPQTASYAIQFLLALRTAGADTCGAHCLVQGNPFWDDFLAGYYHSLSPATQADGDGLAAYQPSWYGDAQTYASTDLISALGALGVYDSVAGNLSRLQSVRWAQTHTPPGGAPTSCCGACPTVTSFAIPCCTSCCMTPLWRLPATRALRSPWSTLRRA
jgi:hypothetical protein